MESNLSEGYKEKQATGTYQKKCLERSYKIARSMFDPLPPKNSSLFHPRQHDDKIEIEITTIRPNSRSFSQNPQYNYTGSRTPKSFRKTSPNNFSYTNIRSPNKTPKRNQNQSYISEPSSAMPNREYYQFLNEYSSSFMNSNSSSPSRTPRYEYNSTRKSYYYKEYEPRVSKHFSPSKGSSSPIMTDSYQKLHTSPPTFRYRDQFPENGNSPRRSLNDGSKRGSSSENDKRKSVGVQRSNSGKYQYEEEPFKDIIEEEEEDINDDNDINSELKMTASTISDILNDDQLIKDRELLMKHMKSNFHHDKWDREAEPDPQIDDTNLDKRVQMIISKLKEQNSISAQNSRLSAGSGSVNNSKANYSANQQIINSSSVNNS